MKINIKKNNFQDRHIGPEDSEITEMLRFIKAESMDDLICSTIPEPIRLTKTLNIPAIENEQEFLVSFKKLAQKNKVLKSFIGLGYYNTFTPTVVQRNILENPGWYTAYTPYQAEIAQGRMEALINFQTVIVELTGMELANASLLDEGTAAAEAMAFMFELRSGQKKGAIKFLVDEQIFPQTLAILKTRALPLNIEILVNDANTAVLEDDSIFGMILQYPGADGKLKEIEPLIWQAKERGILVGVAADLLSLTLLKPPGEMGADVVIGSSQRFGIPMGYGGPHAAYFATKKEFRRFIPGRIIGVSIDRFGNKAFRMALQTREQHIKRERATSNICTSQVLLAVMAGMFAVYHGPKGLRQIAENIHGLTQMLDRGLKKLGIDQQNIAYFDTLQIQLSISDLKKIRSVSEGCMMNFRYETDKVFVSLDETTDYPLVLEILQVFAAIKKGKELGSNGFSPDLTLKVPDGLVRNTAFLQQEVFNKFHKEHEMLRYIKRLENKDLSLVHSMIPLGSCTMKLNASTEMLPLSWPEFSSIHPFAPIDQTIGYQEMFHKLENWLSEICGLKATSLQPNSGAQGEYAGLMVIRSYLMAMGQSDRNIVLIPASAHGTNPASAAMAGMKIVIVKCDEDGNIDIGDLKDKAEQYRSVLAALMVTYPSTHGIFEESIREISDTIHFHGGQVYMDGANMNAQVGLTSPAMIGADVCHINLHKTFCIPHGGGGPGMGPISVAEHLAPFLPGNPIIKTGGNKAETVISAAPWGSASILTISYAYIALMGGKGLKRATEIAILNANYIKEKLKDHYDILYLGKAGRVGHEMILDCRAYKKHGIEVEDIAKRLMDYGFHAPTVSFPVAGTLMIEPTESESKKEIDLFIEAMVSIKKEMMEVMDKTYNQIDNVLKNAPHTQALLFSETWNYPYSKNKAFTPLPLEERSKFWPSVSRVDNAYGDRNLMCSCPPLESYKEDEMEKLEEV